jgi:SGNH domain (fused to AT3 domains)
VPGCLYLSDRYGRDRRKECGFDRSAAEEERKGAVSRLKAAIADIPGLRYIDPFGDFCDDQHRQPYSDNAALFIDSNHLSDAGMDRIIAAHQADFDWLVSAKP